MLNEAELVAGRAHVGGERGVVNYGVYARLSIILQR